ncbi:zinc sigma-54-dependent two-component system response regulator [Desulfocucumis palustris]|uniref:Zinc sigma-54-dependent two-component system response regulator n=2 Tax=Desulfocucumis palustris TaxID=1898651 RepID=A0A2L2XFY4_9FIRM|nr:zinc sigma-54-dependent two-component system response regulator [Desulfocucumis palustris]
MINVPLELLPVLKLLPGEYIFNDGAEVLAGQDNALVVDEKGCFLGKIPISFLNEDIPIRKLHSLVEPVQETIQQNENAVELIEHFKNKEKVVYVTNWENKLIGAVSSDSRVISMLIKMKDNFLFPNIFDAIYEAVLIIDISGSIVYVNHAYTNIVGISGWKILGRKMSEVEPHSSCLKVLKGHSPVINKRYFIESVGVEVLANIIPFYVNGKLEGVVSMFRNVYETINLGHELQRMRGVAEYLHNEEAENKLPEAFDKIVGNNRHFRQALALAANVCNTNATVMLRGDSGTGKEVLAEAIQKSSLRKDCPFIKVNCASIPENLLESELFGYEEGAFTGAKRGGKKGKFELAHKGTIFLDEVGDMSLAMQAKLLRVLQEKEIERVGSSRTIPVDVRVISATNKDLETMVLQKQFRDDLYYRLNVIPIFLPPLRRRKDDIPLLVERFLGLYCKEHGKDKVIVSSEVMNILIDYDWPGNIRELKNVIEHAVILCAWGVVTVEHLPIFFKKHKNNPSAPEWDKESLSEMVEQLEKEAIARALRKYGNKSDAIKALGISRRSFYLKLKKYQMFV